MLKPYLKPYLIGYVNELYEDVDDQLVFAYDEAHATKIVLETFQDAKFVFQSRPVIEKQTAAWSKSIYSCLTNRRWCFEAKYVS